jgi:hypothetical protein
VIADQETGKKYGAWRIADGNEFSIEFVHSVNKTPVTETFMVSGDILQAVQVRFYGFGAGMQSDLGEGQTLSRDGEALVITGFTQTYRELNYIVGTVSDHLLYIGGETISLRDLCGKNAHIRIYIQ